MADSCKIGDHAGEPPHRFIACPDPAEFLITVNVGGSSRTGDVIIQPETASFELHVCRRHRDLLSVWPNLSIKGTE